MNVITYSGQTDYTLREITQGYPHTLVCLDSGTSFRTIIDSNYKPSNLELAITKRPMNISFRQIPGLEASDIKALYETKHRISQNDVNVRTLAKQILSGNESKGIKSLMQPSRVIDVVSLIDTAWTVDQTLYFLVSNYQLTDKDVTTNYALLSCELKIYMEFLPNFYSIYQSL